MKSPSRPSSIIAEQLKDFEALIPQKLVPPPGDFAAQLQWDSWQSHLAELNNELELAIDQEMEQSDLQISLSGKPVIGHSVCAGFLAAILANVEKLVSALSELLDDSIPGYGEEAFGLMIDGAFESSFGVKMRLSSPGLQDENPEKRAQLADRFCGLLDGSIEVSKLDALLTTSDVRARYLALVKCLAKGDGQMFVRTKGVRYGVCMGVYQARQRVEWLADSSRRENIIVITGFFTGGSISSGRFEISGENVYRGYISSAARKQMLGIKLGQKVGARVKETTSIGAQAKSTREHEKAKYFLLEIWLDQNPDEPGQ